jgi:hypothetical protein
MLLAGMMMTGINIIRKAAQKRKIRNQVEQLAEAWDLYLVDHRKFPSASDLSSTMMDEMAMAYLNGSSSRTHTVYYEIYYFTW